MLYFASSRDVPVNPWSLPPTPAHSSGALQSLEAGTRL